MKHEFDFSKLADQQKLIKDIECNEKRGTSYSRRTADGTEYKALHPAVLHAMVEGDALREIIERGEAEDYAEAERILSEKKEKEVSEIENWIKKDLCDPGKAPDFLLADGRYSIGEIFYHLKELNQEEFKKILESDNEIKEMADALEFPPDEEGKPGNKLSIKDEIMMSLAVDEIRKDDRKIAEFVMRLKEKFGRYNFGCGRFGGFKNPTDCGGCVNGEKNLKKIFGEEIPYLVYKGDRRYRMEPFGEYETYGYHEQTTRGIVDYQGIDEYELLAVYGREEGNKLLENIYGLEEKIKMINDEKAKDKDVAKLLKRDYALIKDKMPEAIDTLRRMEPSSLKLKDIDTKHGILALLGSRSEWGSSGGIGYFSRVIAMHQGEVQEKEYQWRDRWSARNDRHKYAFKDLKIDEIEQYGNKLCLSVQADPGEKYYPTSVDFVFDIKTDKQELTELNESERVEFKKFVETEIDKIMMEKMKLWELKPEMLNPIGRNMTAPMNLSFVAPYVRYEQPELKKKIIDEGRGFAAFIIKEQIDHRGSDAQIRFELYVARNGQEAELADEDHAYLHREGDPSITGLRIMGNKALYSTRKGKKEIIL